MRSFATHLIALYLGAGLFGGLLMQQAIPAINLLGVAVYAALWPRFVYCAPVARECKPLEAWPEWMQAFLFTF